MSIDEVKKLYDAAPFRPFQIVLTNSRRVLVDHPEFMALSRNGRTVIVSEKDGATHIDVPLIIELKLVENGSHKRKSKRS